MKKSILLKDFFNNSVTAEQVSKSISDDCLDSLKFVVDDNKPWLYDPTRDLYISIKCKLYKKSGFSDSCCDPKYVPVEEVKYEIPVSDIHQKYGRFYSIYEIDDEDERETNYDYDAVVPEYQHDTYLYKNADSVYTCYLNPDNPSEVSYIDHNHLERYKLPELIEDLEDEYRNKFEKVEKIACVKETYAKLYDKENCEHSVPIVFAEDMYGYFADDGIYYSQENQQYRKNFLSNEKVQEAISNFDNFTVNDFVNIDEEYYDSTKVFVELENRENHHNRVYLDKEGNAFVFAGTSRGYYGIKDTAFVKLSDARLVKFLGTNDYDEPIWNEAEYYTNDFLDENKSLVKFPSGYAKKGSDYVAVLYTATETFYSCTYKRGNTYIYTECTTPTKFESYIEECNAVRATKLLWCKDGKIVKGNKLESWKRKDLEKMFYSPELLVKVDKAYALKSEVEKHLDMFISNLDGTYSLVQ